jgi:methyl-accepting chemotaxis protein
MKHKLQRNLLATLVIGLVVIISTSAWMTSRLFEKTVGDSEVSQFTLMRSIIGFNIAGAEGRALARAELVASLPRVKELFAAKNREGLLAELKQMFEVQRDKFGIDQGQFHLAPATSFLRLNNPSQFGDDLTSFRPIVVAVNNDKVARKGLSISRSGPGIFGVVPVTDRDGKPLGSFEFGGDFGPVLDGVKTAYGWESALFIDEERLKNAAPDLGGDVYSDKNRMGRFVKYKSTNWELLRGLVTDAELSDPGIENAPYVREAQGTPYGVVFTPLRNPAGDLIGMVVTAKNFSSSRAALGQSSIWIAVYALFGIVVLAGLAMVLIKGAVTRPLGVLTERFGALAQGKPAEPIGPREGFYGEVGDLADHYETLRSAKAE